MKTTQYVRQEKAITTRQLEARRRLRELRGMVDGGYLYVVEFSSGSIKVGKAMNPASRLASHANYAQVHGAAILRSWTSRGHPGYSGTERQLIAFCKRRSTQTFGKEYFQGVTFEAARDFADLATQLALDAETYSQLVELDRKRRVYLDALIKAADGNLDMTWQQAHDRLDAELAH